MSDNCVKDEIVEKGKAGFPALYVQSYEDVKSRIDIQNAAAELKRKLFVWTLGKGLIEEGKNKGIDDTEQPIGLMPALQTIPECSIAVLRFFDEFMDDPFVFSSLSDIIYSFKQSKRMLIILTPVIKLTPHLEKEFALIENRLPDKEKLGEIISGIVESSGIPENQKPNKDQRDHLITAAMGMTSSEADNAISLSIVRPKLKKQKNLWDAKIVLEEKCQSLKKTGILEYIPATDGLNSVGGLENLKKWVRKRKNAFTDSARKFGLPQPKGILLVGPPGSGKSLSAKALSAELEMPLLKMDVGKIFGSLVGQTEANLRQAIQTAEALSPCILWVDEVEKGLSGASAGALDSGVGARLVGGLLTWMQEKTSPVFVYATANDVSALPPELLRKGRFDELWSVLLPNKSERLSIFDIHIRKRGRGSLLDSGSINLETLASKTDGFSGAEIESIIVESMYSAFDVGKDLNMLDLTDAINDTKPLSKQMPEKIKKITEWCQNRTRSANEEETTDAIKFARRLDN